MANKVVFLKDVHQWHQKRIARITADRTSMMLLNY